MQEQNLYKNFVKSTQLQGSSEIFCDLAVATPTHYMTCQISDSLYKELPEPSVSEKDANDIIYLEKVHPKSDGVSKHNFFKASEHDDVDTIERALNQGFYVDTKDEFGWTPLMCAICAKAENAIKILLQNGASPRHKEHSGMSVMELAREKEMTHLITNFESEHSIEQSKSEDIILENFYCNKCECEVKDQSLKAHTNSMIHLFNSGPVSDVPSYMLPESNIGYQLMLKSGWNPNVGLGPEGKGKKVPAKTALKTSRKGLGAEKLEPRVTHFKPYEIYKEVANNPPSTKKKNEKVDQDAKKTAEIRRSLFF
ncbi:G patch domain and ankyrin repeat-containing protein 1 homolog [Artemia franciscana]|uniref:G-patch domain-containing protein n=1 Tax=Artemia franciscana TaxID=6661 RepID=A0AA88L6D9_ARTSF|nr:hypothetical protein QYM36_008824 [Artemia franciscana]KAK2714387.1 hypothetical protein QYM36_008824 [Artemia franciscana]